MPSLQTGEYPVYPSDWPQISYAIKQARNWTCEKCSIVQGQDKRNNITVHHKDHNTFNNDDENLLVVCQRCHLRLEHANRKRLRIEHILNHYQAIGQLVLPGIDPFLLPQLNRDSYVAPCLRQDSAT